MVSARVPAEVKEQVGAILREIGSSPTELVNVAYDYVLRYGKLPQVCEDAGAVCIRLTPEQVDELRLRSQAVAHRLPDDFWLGA